MSETQTISDPNNGMRREKCGVLFQMAGLAIALPFVEVFAARWWHDERIWILINSLSMIFLAMRWCFLDARERGIRLGRLTQLVIIGIAAIGIPIWLLRTRGIRGFISIGWAFLFGASLIGINVLASEVAYEQWWPKWAQN